LNKLTRLVVAAAAATAVIAPVTAANAAPARPEAGRHWTTVESGFSAKQQACKVSVNGGSAWKIYNRLNASKVTGGRLASTLTATYQGKPVGARSWKSGWVKKRHISAVGTFRVPRKAGWALQMSLYGDNAGNGGVLKVAAIRHC
jgi:hypothetical protein